MNPIEFCTSLDREYLLLIIKGFSIILLLLSIATELSLRFKDTPGRIIARGSTGIAAAIMYSKCDLAQSTPFLFVVTLMMGAMLLSKSIDALAAIKSGVRFPPQTKY